MGYTFSPQTTYATGSVPDSVTTADVNGDGHADLVVANASDNTVSVLLGTGTGTFGAQTTYATGSGPISVTTADVNGDGHADLVVANSSDNTVSVLLGTGTGTFGAQTTYATGTSPFSVTTADVNGDGHPDLVVTNLNSNTVSVLLGTGTGTFGAQTTYATGSGPYSVERGRRGEHVLSGGRHRRLLRQRHRGQFLQWGAFVDEGVDEATRLFRLAASDCPHGFNEWDAANAELKALGVVP
jgi:hypothetical protein